MKWVCSNQNGTISLGVPGEDLPVAILQKHLDEYLESHQGEIGYIHESVLLKKLASQDNSIGFELPLFRKDR